MARETRSKNARRVQNREEREERVRTGKTSARHDYRCPLCGEWFSRYRNRHGLHRAHCERKQALRMVQMERKMARTSVPPPDDFTPEPTVNPSPGPSAPHSPTPVPLTPGDNEEDQQIPRVGDFPYVDLQRVEGTPVADPATPNEPPASDEALAAPVGDDEPSESRMRTSSGIYAHVRIRCGTSLTTRSKQTGHQQ